MVFKTVEEEANLSGLKIENTFSNVLTNIKAIFSKDSWAIDFSSISESVSKDAEAITNFENAIDSNVSRVDAYNTTMLEASSKAQEYVKTTNDAGVSVDGFTKYLNKAQVTVTASNKGLSSCKKIIDEYNGGFKNCNLAQEEFIGAVSQSNTDLGKYLTNLNGAKASMVNYTAQLVAGKVATFALQAATLALNAALSLGVSLLISKAISVITEWANREEEAREAAIEAGDAAKEEAEDIKELYSEYMKANAAYESNTGTKSALTDATDELLEALGIEKSEINGLIEEYGNLDDAINQVTIDALNEKQNTLLSGINGYKEEALYVEAYFCEPDISNPDDLYKLLSVCNNAGGLTPNKAKSILYKAMGETAEDYEGDWGDVPLAYTKNQSTPTSTGLDQQISQQIQKSVEHNDLEIAAVLKEIRALLMKSQNFKDSVCLSMMCYTFFKKPHHH